MSSVSSPLRFAAGPHSCWGVSVLLTHSAAEEAQTVWEVALYWHRVQDISSSAASPGYPCSAS